MSIDYYQAIFFQGSIVPVQMCLKRITGNQETEFLREKETCKIFEIFGKERVNKIDENPVLNSGCSWVIKII